MSDGPAEPALLVVPALRIADVTCATLAALGEVSELA